MAADILPDAVWDEIKPLLPPPPPPSPKGGRPPVDDRAALRGILYVDRYGIPWQALPTRAFGVSGSSCWRRLRDWTAAGVWPALLDGLPAVQGPRGRPRRKPGLIFGDRAYGTAAMILFVLSMGIGCFLARRAGRAHGSGLGAFRYVVERTLANLSRFRRVALCYEQWPEHWQALNEIAACCLVAKRLEKHEL